ncbi:MAG: hypothetical protein NTU63_01875 [Candidatus Pacearchaeota archaeon]|nr:hypothetical protein [Candidatus Pacearchaeota archaeon]
MEESVHKKSLFNLVEYFKKNLKKGYPVDTLRIALINQGYVRQIIDNAAKEAIKQLADQAPILKEKPQIEHELINENDKPIVVKRPWWKRLLGL